MGNSEPTPSGSQIPLTSPVNSAPQEPKLPGPVELLKSALALSQKHFWPLVLIISVPTLLSALIGAVTSLGVSFSPYLVAFAVLLAIPIIVFIVWAYLAFFYALAHSEEQGVDIKQSFKATWPKILSWLWLCLLMTLVILGGFFLLVVPGIIFAIWFSLYIYVFILEDQKGLNVLLRSKEYVQGRWWAVFGRGLFLILPLLGVMIAFGILTAILGVFLPQEIVGLILSVLWVGIYIPIYFYHYLLYKACRDTRPHLASQPPTSKKGWFVASAWLGGVAVILIPILVIAGIALFGNVINKLQNSSTSTSTIYYGGAQYKNWTNNQIRADCEVRGGTFNACGPLFEGSPAAVCSPVCYLKGNQNSSGTINSTNASSTVDTSTWKTYRNDKYGFEVKYPVNLDIILKECSNQFLCSYETEKAKLRVYDSIYASSPFSLDVVSAPNAKVIAFSINSFSLDALKARQEGLDSFVSENILTTPFGSTTIRVFASKYSGSGSYFETIFYNNKIFLEVSGDSANKDLAEKILSTFRFTPTP